ncbi:MAG: ECF transporter S component [Candidatus Bathyarchaeia archaeon]
MVIIASFSLMSFRVKGLEVKGGPFITPLEAAFTALFSALTAVLTGTTGIMLPSPTGGYTHIGDTAIYISALLFGVKVGGLVGIIGPVVADLFVGYPRWFVTVLAHGLQGFIAGLGRKRSIILQAAILAAAGFVMSTVYFFVNIFIKGYPVAIISYFRDLFGQSLVSIILGLILSRGVERALPALRKR